MDQDAALIASYRRAGASDSRQEWLLTNGVGGFAMGTLPGINMRRYHGLLIAAASPPVGRVVALHSIIELIDIVRTPGDEPRTYALSSQHFGEEPITHPHGARHLREVTVNLPHAIQWLYSFDGAEVRRTLRLLPQRNCAVVSHELLGGAVSALIRMRPLVGLRNFHALNRAGDESIEAVDHTPTSVRTARGGLALDLMLSAETDGIYVPGDDWWRNFSYVLDRQRGQDFREDVFTPGRFEVTLTKEKPRAEISAELTLPRREAPDAQAAGTSERSATTPRERLECAGSQFIVKRRVGEIDSTSIIAGYPWFADWGRDTMISLPGLLLTTGRFAEAERCLLTFARHMRSGLLPNRFDDHGGAAHYNTVDASLWFIHSVGELLMRSPGAKSRAELIAACRSIIQAYREGTDFGIRMDANDALIAAGDANTQLTWMDAQRDGVTFTPRHGKPIEINALWHHALRVLAQLTESGNEAGDLEALAERAGGSMRELFWCQRTGCCFDVLVPNGDDWIGDDAIRPNQVLTVSLDPSPFDARVQQSIMRVVRERLLTPYGLRTLDPAHPAYKDRFEGDLFARDAAYHQGTVWPWLIGPYCEATLRMGGLTDDAKREVMDVIRPLLAVIDASDEGTCAGQIAEVYDGDPPHRPSGCPAQAWSVAEVLRVLAMVEE